MHMDPIMPVLVGTIAAILCIGLALQAARQPQVVGYLVAGIVLGPGGLGVMTDQESIARLGDVGVVLLLFFVGMEIKLPELMTNWKVPVVGTILQIAVTVGALLGVGAAIGWPPGRSVLLGFVVSLSSTAVVMKLLQTRGELATPIGRDVIGVLLVQDVLIVPMMIAIGVLGGTATEPWRLGLQVVGGAAAAALLLYVATRERIHLPLARWLGRDHELQVFGAGLLCFGLALLTGLAGLSAALGAFIGGVVVGAARETEWIREAMFPLHVILLALFFVSVGMLIDIPFLLAHGWLVAGLVAAVIVGNTALNAIILRLMGRGWRDAIYGGAALSQIGEFSFVLAAVGTQAGLIGEFSYRTTILVIAMTLLVSPTWIALATPRGELAVDR